MLGWCRLVSRAQECSLASSDVIEGYQLGFSDGLVRHVEVWRGVEMVTWWKDDGDGEEESFELMPCWRPYGWANKPRETRESDDTLCPNESANLAKQRETYAKHLPFGESSQG